MDDSRKVQKSPAGSLDTSQILTDPCPVCHENNWIIDPSPAAAAAALRAADLKPYQFIAHLPGGDRLAYCRHCVLVDHNEQARAQVRANLNAASPLSGEAAAKAEREYYLARLLFAARELAASRFTRSAVCRPDGSVTPMCADCRLEQTSDARLTHTAECPTGRVLQLLDALMNVPPVPQIPKLERRPCEEISPEPASAALQLAPRPTAERPAEFGEPWNVGANCYVALYDRNGLNVVDMSGSELVEEDDELYAARIAACVNACVGIDTLLLSSAPPRLFEALLRARQEGGAR